MVGSHVLEAQIVTLPECVLPVCDKPYHINNGFQQMWAEIKNLLNHALFYVLQQCHLIEGTRRRCAVIQGAEMQQVSNSNDGDRTKTLLGAHRRREYVVNSHYLR